MSRCLTMLAAAVAIAACGDDHTQVLASDFDSSCNTSADCVIVHVGSCSDICGLPVDYAAINVRDLPRQQAAFKGLKCGSGTSDCDLPPVPTSVACTDNACALQY